MPDVFTKAKRSHVMSRIRARGNKATELALASLLRARRITGWRRHQSVFGNPDFVFRAQRLAVFVDGCFWHACPMHSKTPSTNRKFWTEKLRRNAARDKRVARMLRRKGWRVVRIWEHDLQEQPHKAVFRIVRELGANG